MPRGSRPGERRGGRQKGTPDKSTDCLDSILQEHDYDPLAEVIKQLKEPLPTIADIIRAKKILEDQGEEITKELMKRLASNVITVEKKLDANLTLMKYLFPQRKAVELSGKIETETYEEMIKRVRDEKRQAQENQEILDSGSDS